MNTRKKVTFTFFDPKRFINEERTKGVTAVKRYKLFFFVQLDGDEFF